MIDAFRQFGKRYPNFTLLMIGVSLTFLPIGVGMNSKFLVEHDLMPYRLWFLLPVIGGLMATSSLAGCVLIGIAAWVLLRRMINKSTSHGLPSEPRKDS